jgi:hypothetical protein
MPHTRFSPSVPTVASRRAAARRLKRLTLGIAGALSALRDGECLHLHICRRAGPTWWLSRSGRKLDPEVALAVIKNPNVVGVGDSLWVGAPAQTYRYVEPQSSKKDTHHG